MVITDRYRLAETGPIPVVSDLCDLAGAMFDGVALVTFANGQLVKVLGAGRSQSAPDADWAAFAARFPSNLTMFVAFIRVPLPRFVLILTTHCRSGQQQVSSQHHRLRQRPVHISRHQLGLACAAESNLRRHRTVRLGPDSITLYRRCRRASRRISMYRSIR